MRKTFNKPARMFREEVRVTFRGTGRLHVYVRVKTMSKCSDSGNESAALYVTFSIFYWIND